MRLFLAMNFPSEVLRDLNERIARVRQRLPAASWVREETQHLTFAFLGEQPEAMVGRIASPLTTSLAKITRFDAHLQDCGFFPNPRHPRVGWVGIRPDERVCAIANSVRDVVKKHGIELDGGEFRPHLTLMRMRDPWPPASIDLFNKTLREYKSSTFPVDKVTLYSSELHPKGAIHTPLETFVLAES